LGVLDHDVVGGRAAVAGDEVVLGGVHGDPVQPGIELRVPAEAPDRAVGPDEGLLRDVLALAPVVHVAPHDRGDPVLVLADQEVERGQVALLHAADEVVVGLRAGGFGHGPVLSWGTGPGTGGWTFTPGKGAALQDHLGRRSGSCKLGPRGSSICRQSNRLRIKGGSHTLTDGAHGCWPRWSAPQPLARRTAPLPRR